MPSQYQIRVLIVDDHEVVREGLSAVLSNRVLHDGGTFELVGPAKNGEEAMRICDRSTPDVILMDLNMPTSDVGIKAIRDIHIKYPAMRIIVLTSSLEDNLVKTTLEVGAIGYLLKTVSSHDLIKHIQDAYSGEPVFSPEVTKSLFHLATQPLPPGYDLTDREREVLALIIKGYSNTGIAEQLTVSPATIKTHLNNIFSKLHVNNRTQAAALAMEYHIV